MTEATMSARPATDNTLYILFISVVAALGGFLFGFDSGVINGTVEGLAIALQSDSIGSGFNVASMLLGCAVGAFFAGHLADLYGRRRLLQVAALFFLASAWGSGIASSSLEFVSYRILGGLAVGAASVLAPAYISEITPARYRGAMTSIQQIAIISGLFAAFISNYLLAGVAGSATARLWWEFQAWRWMFWAELLPAALFFAALWFIPESPRFLVLSRQDHRADIVLGHLFGFANARRMRADIEASLASDHHRPRLGDLVDRQRGGLLRIAWVGIGLATFQQLVGINVVFYYGAVLWQSVGFSEADALLVNIISGGISIVACLITITVVDRIGRKPLLLIGSVGMTAALMTLAVVFSNAPAGAAGRLVLEGNAGPVALVAANAYVFLFNMTWGPVMWVMLGEMFPNQLRGSGLALAGLFQWGSNFVVTMTFPLLLTGIGLGGAYGFYTLSACLSILFVLFAVRETRGLELEQMTA